MRLTKHRQAILDYLENCPQALSVSQIHAALPEINLVTIYRSLDYFVENKLITKLNLNSDEATYEKQHEPHHHAVCNECNKIIHFTLDDENLKKEFSLPGFNIKDVEITIRGNCKAKHQKTKVK